jgi:acyl-CoA thioester hydrolase
MYRYFEKIRVRYSETDRMGFVYYGNYAQYFEVARVEALRNLNLSYKELEENGIMLPVRSFSIDYFKPAHYDDLLTIETLITDLPTAKIKFSYTTFNEQKVLLNKATVELVFMDAKTGKPTRPPSQFFDQLKPFFS